MFGLALTEEGSARRALGLVGEPRVAARGQSIDVYDRWTAPAGSACRVEINPARGVIARRPAAAAFELYWATEGARLLVTTHMQLFRAMGLELAEDPEAAAESLMSGIVAPPRTLLRGAGRLAPGEVLTAAPVGHKWRVEVSPAPLSTASCPCDEEAVVLEIEAGLREALPGGEEAFCLLSGGLDSSILAALLATGQRRLPTLSTSYWFEEEAEDGERAYAESAGRWLGTSHANVEPGAGAFAVATVEAIAASGAPLPYLQCSLLHAGLVMSRTATRDTGMVGQIIVNGQGADAIFAPSVSGPGRASPLASRDLRELAFTAARLAERGVEGVVRDAASRISVNDATSGWSLDLRQDAYRQMVSPAQHAWSSSAAWLGAGSSYPYLSSRVLAAAQLVDPATAGRETKRVLRELARRLELPAELITRPKLSFGARSQTWGPCLASLAAAAFGDRAGCEMRPLLADRRARYLTWNLVNLGLWRRLVVDGEDVRDVVGEVTRRCRSTKRRRR